MVCRRNYSRYDGLRRFVRIEYANHQRIATGAVIVEDYGRDGYRIPTSSNSMNRINELIDPRGLSRVDAGKEEEERSDEQKEQQSLSSFQFETGPT